MPKMVSIRVRASLPRSRCYPCRSIGSQIGAHRNAFIRRTMLRPRSLNRAGEMNVINAQKLDIEIGNAASVSALLTQPPKARACFVFAHGAGAGMTHPFMETVASGLGERGIATLRYQFPYMEKGSKRPDPPGIAQATVRAAVAEAERHCADLRLIA